MAKFRVTLHAPIFGKNVNPFAKIHFNLHDTVEVAARVWEFEAKDEDEVRALFKEAQDKKLPYVRGFNLHRIERLDASPGDKHA